MIDNLTVTGSNTLEANVTAAIFQARMITLDGPNGFINESGYSPLVGPVPQDDSPQKPTDTGPVRVLPVLNSIQYPLCPATGWDADTDTFTFSAADAYGPGNITDLQIIFSQFAPGANGMPGGPGNPNGDGQGGICHFGYYPASNTVWIDNQNGEYEWYEHSVVGSGGTDITNGFCTVHAGSSYNSQAVMGPRNLDLTLTVTFPSSSTSPSSYASFPTPGSTDLYLYEYTEDTTNGYDSYGGGWYYWGWWAAP